GGANDGFQAGWQTYVDGRVSVALMTNADNGMHLIPEFVRGLAEVYGWQYGAQEKLKLAEWAPQRMQAVVGQYTFRPGADEPAATVMLIDGELFVEGDGRSRLYPVADDRMVIVEGQSFNVVTDESGAVTMLRFDGRWDMPRWTPPPTRPSTQPAADEASDE
ncbi:MAG: hypothetical protein AAGK78_01720, partial [Planctomycetota bacterium]